MREERLGHRDLERGAARRGEWRPEPGIAMRRRDVKSAAILNTLLQQTESRAEAFLSALFPFCIQ